MNPMAIGRKREEEGGEGTKQQKRVGYGKWEMGNG